MPGGVVGALLKAGREETIAAELEVKPPNPNPNPNRRGREPGRGPVVEPEPDLDPTHKVEELAQQVSFLAEAAEPSPNQA